MQYAPLRAIVLVAALSATSLSAQDYFWFDDGGIISPAEGTVDQLDLITIDYSACAGTDEGLNIGNGKGQDWIVSDAGTYSVTFTDDYQHHVLELRVVNGPIVKAGDYKLSIPEGAFNVYGNASLINDAVSYRWTVSGTNDVETPTLHLIDSYPAEGEALQLPVEALTLTFDQDVALSHSTFDAAGRISNLTSGGYIQLDIKAEGNVLRLSRGMYSSSDFYAGQQYELQLFAGHIFAAADPSLSLPETIIAFSVAGADDTEGLKVMTQIPTAGANIHNAGSITFNMPLTDVDASLVSLVNDLGHQAPLSYVGRDMESPRSLIFNIAPDTQLQPGTTYRLHLEAGAVTADTYTNEAMDAAYWCIPQPLFTFTSALADATVPCFDSVTLTAEAVEGIRLAGEEAAIRVTGVSSNAGYVYAELASLAIGEGSESDVVTLRFDRTITPELLEQGGAIYNSVKVVVPEGTFADADGRLNGTYEFVVYVIEPKEMGPQTWTFKPADGAEVDRLGSPWYGEEEDGTSCTYYNISFEVSGENVYARIPDGSLLTLRNTLDGKVEREFGRNDVIGRDNRFSLELGVDPVTADGVYQLVIPAEAIYLYSDPDFRTEPIHPEADVTATWTVGHPELSLDALRPEADALRPAFDLLGRPVKAGSTQVRIYKAY